MDQLISNLTNLSVEHHSAPDTQTDIINLTRTYFSILENESYSQEHIDEHILSWQQLPTGTLQAVHKLAMRELKGFNTDLHCRDVLSEIGLYNTTHFRSTDQYYISMLVDFLENIDNFY